MIKSPRREGWERAFLELGLRPVNELHRGRWVLWSAPGVSAGVGFFALIWSDGLATVVRSRCVGGKLSVAVASSRLLDPGDEPGADGGIRVPGGQIDSIFEDWDGSLPPAGSALEARLLEYVAEWARVRAGRTALAQAADRQRLALRRALRAAIAGGREVHRDELADLAVALETGGTPDGRLRVVGNGSGPFSEGDRRDVGNALCLPDVETWDWMQMTERGSTDA